jgi:hypothetical protein
MSELADFDDTLRGKILLLMEGLPSIFQHRIVNDQRLWSIHPGPGRSIAERVMHALLAWKSSGEREAAIQRLVSDWDILIPVVRTSKGSTVKLNARQKHAARVEALMRAYLERFTADVPRKYEPGMDSSDALFWMGKYWENVSSSTTPFTAYHSKDMRRTLTVEDAAADSTSRRHVIVVGCGFDSITTNIDSFIELQESYPHLDITFALAVRPSVVRSGLFADSILLEYKWALYSLDRLCTLVAKLDVIPGEFEGDLRSANLEMDIQLHYV